MLWEFLVSAKDLNRTGEIAAALIRYGFGGFVQAVGLGKILERVGKTLNWQNAEEFAHLDTPHRIRHLLEELGPTFIKLGQILATRIDLFPPPYICEFEKLLDEVSPISFAELRPQIEEDIGGAIDGIFLAVDPHPLAAASLAQVHKAVLKNGESVILKIRRPGIRKLIEADLRLLNRLVEAIENEVQGLQRYHPREIVRQISQSLRKELDFAMESRNSERVAANLADNINVLIPKVYWEFTGERLNVQEYIQGISGRDVCAARNAGLNTKLLAERGAKAVLQMIMVDGFFHADPHPGNVFYLPDNRLAFIDFGMMGRLTDERRNQVVSFLYAMINHNPVKVVEIMEDWSNTAKIENQTLVSEVDAFVDQYSSLAFKDLNLPKMIGDLMDIMRENNLSLPPDLALLIKAYITLDGFGKFLDPECNSLVLAQPIMQQLIADRYKPETIAKRGWRDLTLMAEILAALPKEIRQLLRISRKGTLQLDINVINLDRSIAKLDSAVSRLTMGIIAAALIVGTSVIMTVDKGNEIMGLSIFALVGYISASIIGMWLLFSIWRGNK
jgi:ubiquinone biosynthesis protein